MHWYIYATLPYLFFFSRHEKYQHYYCSKCNHIGAFKNHIHVKKGMCKNSGKHDILNKMNDASYIPLWVPVLIRSDQLSILEGLSGLFLPRDSSTGELPFNSSGELPKVPAYENVTSELAAVLAETKSASSAEIEEWIRKQNLETCPTCNCNSDAHHDESLESQMDLHLCDLLTASELVDKYFDQVCRTHCVVFQSEAEMEQIKDEVTHRLSFFCIE